MAKEDPAMQRVLEALKGGSYVDPDDMASVLAYADANDLWARGKRWMMVALWQAQTRLLPVERQLQRAEAELGVANARLLELELQLEPLRNRNRQLKSALLTVRRALETTAIRDSDD